MEMTGINPEFLESFHAIVNDKLAKFKSENPDYEADENTCEVCSNEPLAVIGSLSSATDGKMAYLIPDILLDYDYYYVFDAISWYIEEGSRFKTVAKICAYVGNYFKEIQSECLNTEMIVAKYDGELGEGNNLTLTFNVTLFKEKYEKALNERTGENWVAEEVKAFMYHNEESNELVPVLHISAFNIDKERSSNLFMIANSNNVNGGSLRLAARDVITITCEATNGCSQDNCSMKFSNGRYYCHNTCSTGECESVCRCESIMYAACNVMHNLIY